MTVLPLKITVQVSVVGVVVARWCREYLHPVEGCAGDGNTAIRLTHLILFKE